MSVVFVTTSPKKHRKWANSTYFLDLVGLYLKRQDKIRLNLAGVKDYPAIFDACKEAQILVIAMPVYVDAIPSHVLEFLQAAEQKAQNWNCKVYIITNCGFYEGNQCELLLNQMACWCKRTGLEYGGGLGVGAGEMLGILRVANLILGVFITLLAFALELFYLIVTSNFSVTAAFNGIHLIPLGVNIGLYLLWSMGLLIGTARFGMAIRNHRTVHNRFTTVWFCGRYLFTAFASLFWIIRAAGNRIPIWKIFQRPVIDRSN